MRSANATYESQVPSRPDPGSARERYQSPLALCASVRMRCVANATGALRRRIVRRGTRPPSKCAASGVRVRPLRTATRLA